MKSIFAALACSSALLLPSCGGVTVTDDASGGSGGGSGGGGPATGGKCAYLDEQLTLAFQLHSGEASICDGASSGLEVAIEGVVISHDDAALTIDSCPPNAGCAPMISTLSIAAPGLDVHVPAGAFVQVAIAQSFNGFTGCTQAIRVDNLPTWGGVENPKDAGSRTWLFAKDGVEASDVAEPFEVASVNVCGDANTADEVIHDVRFTAEEGGSVTLSSGETAELSTGGVAYRVHNLRCVTICCHGGPCGYWIASK